MAQVVLENVNKRFDSNLVVKDVSLTIRDKEFVVLVGPSGCGKTTSLRMIAGLEEITDGRILIDNRVVNDVPPKDRDIAMVFQNYALYPHMSVYDNMAFGLKIRGVPKQEIATRVHEAAEILELNEYLARLPKQLSGGQRQRVALGRAIVRKPKVFLMDEPLSNLDAKLRVQMRAEIKKLHAKLRATIVYVTHDQVEAMTLGDRIVVMHKGEVQQMDRPMDIYQKPGNKFVAGFIGSPPMNFIRGQLRQEGGDIAFVAEGITFRLPGDVADIARPHAGKKVILGIRPEDIWESSNGHHGDVAQMTCRVDFRELMGSETYLYFRVGATQLIARANAFTEAKAGSDVELRMNLRGVHLFDDVSHEAMV